MGRVFRNCSKIQPFCTQTSFPRRLPRLFFSLSFPLLSISCSRSQFTSIHLNFSVATLKKFFSLRGLFSGEGNLKDFQALLREYRIKFYIPQNLLIACRTFPMLCPLFTNFVATLTRLVTYVATVCLAFCLFLTRN